MSNPTGDALNSSRSTEASVRWRVAPGDATYVIVPGVAKPINAGSQKAAALIVAAVNAYQQSPEPGGEHWPATQDQRDGLAFAAKHETEPGAQWQPIETAPMEGRFLVYMPDEIAKVQHARRNVNNVFIIGNQFAFDLSKPTHWMPEPAFPETKDAQS